MAVNSLSHTLDLSKAVSGFIGVFWLKVCQVEQEEQCVSWIIGGEGTTHDNNASLLRNVCKPIKKCSDLELQ